MNSEKFSFPDIKIDSKDAICDRCKAQGFNKNIIIVPIEMEVGKTTPKVIALLCKSCLQTEKMTYEEYLKLVALKPIGD